MSRLLVIAMCAKNADFVHRWAKKMAVPYHLQPPSVLTSHSVGESLSYFEYIAENYNNLADHTIFNDDAGGRHWHVENAPGGIPAWVRAVRRAEPARFQGIGEILGDRNVAPEGLNRAGSALDRRLFLAKCISGEFSSLSCGAEETSEWPCIKVMLDNFNKSYDVAKHDAHCGGCFVVSKEAIRSIPRAGYQAMVDRIKGWSTDRVCLSGKWGYALERMKGVLWA